jgi:hypothetical protein
MTGRGTAFRELAVSAESERPSETDDQHGQLDVPTMEERALIFLRAVKGKKDFTSDEYIEARGKILDAMAADIAARSQPEEIGEGGTTPTPTLPEDLLKRPHSAPDIHMGFREESFTVAQAMQPPRSARDDPVELAQVPQAVRASKRKGEKLRMFFWGIVIFIVAGLCVLGGVTLVRMAIDLLRISAQ